MSTAVSPAPVVVADPICSSDIRRAMMADDSPFGVQGLARQTLRIFKADCISRLGWTWRYAGRRPRFATGHSSIM